MVIYWKLDHLDNWLEISGEIDDVLEIMYGVEKSYGHSIMVNKVEMAPFEQIRAYECLMKEKVTT